LGAAWRLPAHVRRQVGQRCLEPRARLLALGLLPTLLLVGAGDHHP